MQERSAAKDEKPARVEHALAFIKPLQPFLGRLNAAARPANEPFKHHHELGPIKQLKSVAELATGPHESPVAANRCDTKRRTQSWQGGREESH